MKFFQKEKLANMTTVWNYEHNGCVRYSYSIMFKICNKIFLISKFDIMKKILWVYINSAQYKNYKKITTWNEKVDMMSPSICKYWKILLQFIMKISLTACFLNYAFNFNEWLKFPAKQYVRIIVWFAAWFFQYEFRA